MKFIFKVVRQLGSDFVCNFIQSMDGERDPRNLVLCFQCLQYITKHLDIGKIINRSFRQSRFLRIYRTVQRRIIRNSCLLFSYGI
jgi:hypothetical protein